VVLQIVCALSLAIWIYLLVGHGRFWRTSVRLPNGPDPARWPSVAAIVPARDEADVLPGTLPSLIAQNYAGPFRVIVVDDASGDPTARVASALGADVVPGTGPTPGWVGKVAAMAAGVEHAGDCEYVLFTDADIAYPANALEALVRAAVAHRLDLTSQMVRLRAQSRWERIVVPAFVYFFAQLFPFGRVNRPGRTAAAAGGCMLVRRAALEQAGGLGEIRDALIDDVALGQLLKRNGRVWLGLSPDIRSVRRYPRLADLWQMVSRSAYTQLRYSPALLVATVAGLLLTYAVPPAALAVGLALGDPLLAGLGATAWAVMAATYLPMLRFYRVSPLSAPALPAVAALYAAMTVDSARRHRLGRGGQWKGRVTQPLDNPEGRARRSSPDGR
jgi:hopene-associated glycosyltransferase HpnB